MCGGGGLEKGHRAQSNAEPAKQELGRKVLEKSRKRKQVRPVRNKSPSMTAAMYSPLAGTPTKKMKKLPGSDLSDAGDEEEETPELALTLLERKKKLVKKDGLYKFVLWREALRDEKTKLYFIS